MREVYKKISCIYKITNPIGNIYIGQTTDFVNRHYSHKKNVYIHKNRICRSFQEFGFENHKFEIIEECEINELKNRERYWQDFYNCCGEKGLNSFLTKTDTLDGSSVNDFKHKMSQLQRSINKIKRSVNGVEMCRKVKVNKFKPINSRLLLPKYKGVNRNLPRRKEVKVVKKRKQLSEDNINRLKTMNIGKPSKKKGVPNGRKGLKNKYSVKRNSRLVLDMYLGIYYDSVTEAAMSYEVKRSTLHLYLSGVRANKTNLCFV